METILVRDLNPIYREIYMSALKEQGLNVYSKDQNLDAWIRAIDIFLVYQDQSDLELARKIIIGLNPES